MHRKDKGDLAELKIAADLVSRGYKVSFPFGERSDYDLIVERSNELERVQVKYVESHGVSAQVLCQTCSVTNGKVRSWRRYTPETVDWMAVYDRSTDRCFYLPSDVLSNGRCALTLRIRPPLNNQVIGVWMADRYTTI